MLVMATVNPEIT